MVGVLGGDERGRKKRMVRNISRLMGIVGLLDFCFFDNEERKLIIDLKVLFLV